MRKRILVYLIAIAALLVPDPYEAAAAPKPGDLSGSACVKDADHDGRLEVNEFRQCLATGDGYLCPIDTVQCTPVYTPASCPDGGLLDTGRDRCRKEPVVSCPARYVWDRAADRCVGAAGCPGGGRFNAAADRCEMSASDGCGTGYTLNAATGLCLAPPSCPPDPARNSCNTGEMACPYGSYPCRRDRGRSLCSPFACGAIVEKQADMSSYQDNGGRDQNTGQCAGRIYIFNGQPGECKEPGVSTTWFQCCSTDESAFLFIEKNCGTGDMLTAAAMKAKRTHFVGTYCKKKFPFIGCVQSAQTHCVFQSKLGRIVQEQGRLQLKAFLTGSRVDWGTAENPNCRGFTPEEFQFLDFSKMDLSEFFADIKAKAAEVIRGELEGRVDEFYDSTVH
jgi:conjugal transfer mating pair stabilization protein TraN